MRIETTPMPAPRDLPAPPPAPLHAALGAGASDGQAIVEFLAWAQSRGYRLCSPPDDSRAFEPIEDAFPLITEYQGLDLEALRREREAVVDYLQRVHRRVHGGDSIGDRFHGNGGAER